MERKSENWTRVIVRTLNAFVLLWLDEIWESKTLQCDQISYQGGSNGYIYIYIDHRSTKG